MAAEVMNLCGGTGIVPKPPPLSTAPETIDKRNSHRRLSRTRATCLLSVRSTLHFSTMRYPSRYARFAVVRHCIVPIPASQMRAPMGTARDVALVPSHRAVRFLRTKQAKRCKDLRSSRLVPTHQGGRSKENFVQHAKSDVVCPDCCNWISDIDADCPGSKHQNGSGKDQQRATRKCRERESYPNKYRNEDEKRCVNKCRRLLYIWVRGPSQLCGVCPKGRLRTRS